MRKDERGQSMVETALLLPILLLLLAGIIDFGRLMYSYSTLHMAAQETVRLGALGKNDTEINTFAHQYVHMENVSSMKVDISPSDTARHAGDYVTVKLHYPFKLYTPLISALMPAPFEIETESTIRVE